MLRTNKQLQLRYRETSYIDGTGKGKKWTAVLYVVKNAMIF